MTTDPVKLSDAERKKVLQLAADIPWMNDSARAGALKDFLIEEVERILTARLQESRPETCQAEDPRVRDEQDVPLEGAVLRREFLRLREQLAAQGRLLKLAIAEVSSCIDEGCECGPCEELRRIRERIRALSPSASEALEKYVKAAVDKALHDRGIMSE